MRDGAHQPPGAQVLLRERPVGERDRAPLERDLKPDRERVNDDPRLPGVRHVRGREPDVPVARRAVHRNERQRQQIRRHGLGPQLRAQGWRAHGVEAVLEQRQPQECRIRRCLAVHEPHIGE